MEMEATGAPQKHHYTLNQQVGSITGRSRTYSPQKTIQTFIGNNNVSVLTMEGSKPKRV